MTSSRYGTASRLSALNPPTENQASTRSQVVREMTWDSIHSQANTPSCSARSKSPSTVPLSPLFYSNPYDPLPSSYSVGPQTPSTSPRPKSDWKPASYNCGSLKTRELSFDSIWSGSQVVPQEVQPASLLSNTPLMSPVGPQKWRQRSFELPSSSPPASSSPLEQEDIGHLYVGGASSNAFETEQDELDDPDVDVVGVDDLDVDSTLLDDPDVDVVGLDGLDVGLGGMELPDVGLEDMKFEDIVLAGTNSSIRANDLCSSTEQVVDSSALPLKGKITSRPLDIRGVKTSRRESLECFTARDAVATAKRVKLDPESQNRSTQPRFIAKRNNPKPAPVEHNLSDDVIDISDNTDDEEYVSVKLTKHQPQKDDNVRRIDREENVAAQKDGADRVESEWIPCQDADFSARLMPLRNCIELWAMGYDWNAAAEQNPIWDLNNRPLMGQQAMDSVVCYLAYHATHLEPTHRRTCVILPSLYGNIKHFEGVEQGTDAWLNRAGSTSRSQLFHQRQMVWTRTQAPTRVLLPVIDHECAHSYLWYGEVTQKHGRTLYHCNLHYLDSLARPSARVFTDRLNEAKSIVRFLLPQIDGEITGDYESIPGYRQRAGSTDCGFFVCQATSALLFHRDSALKNLVPVHSVRQRIICILEACRDKALLRLTEGFVSRNPIILHNHPTTAPPPWLSPPDAPSRPIRPAETYVSPWNPPSYERSLSEPTGEYMLETSRGGWEDVLGSAAKDTFASFSSSAFKGYVEKMGQGGFNPPPGVLTNAGAQLPDQLLPALLLDGAKTQEPVSWMDGLNVPEGHELGGLEAPEDGLGIGRFSTALSYLREGKDRSLALLTGTRNGKPLRLNWEMDAVDLEENWLSCSMDIDSLSLTVSDPDFIIPVVLHAYPPRASTITTDNGLRIIHNGEPRPLSHFPNFTLLNLGSNNQFRVNIVFPQYEKGKNNGGRFITMMTAEDFAVWFNKVILPAVRRVLTLAPENLKDSAIRLAGTLPKCYDLAQDRVHRSGGRSFTGFKVIPQLINMILRQARHIVDSKPYLVKFRGYFFHIWGIDLKPVGQVIDRQEGSTLLRMLESYPLVDWSLQNPRDIVVDVGIEINVRDEKLPLDIKNLTLVWKLEALKRLVNSSWRQPTIDAYVHSHVVGGVSCKPRSHVSKMMHYFHAYQKDKTLTYIHRDNSIGSGFSPEDGILGDKAYVSETRALDEAWSCSVGSFGVRAEWRCGVWAASKMLTMDPDIWLRRFLLEGAFLGYHTLQVVMLKRTMLSGYKWFFSNIQELPTAVRKAEEVRLLAAVLAYLIHGLIQRPDDMSSSRAMVKDLGIVTRAIIYGFASIPSERLAPDMVRMSGDVDYERYPILKYISRKNPAGARLKTSHRSTLESVEQAQPESGSTCDHVNDGRLVWTPDDQEWIEQLLNVTLAGWIWGRMPEQDRQRHPERGAHSGPLIFARWAHAVDQGVQYRVRATSTKFSAALARFLPVNWQLIEAESCWRTLNTAFLEPIQERIEQVDRAQQADYSAHIRLSANEVLRSWEYLPCSRKREVWSYEGSGKTKRYMVYRNPNFVSRRL